MENKVSIVKEGFVYDITPTGITIKTTDNKLITVPIEDHKLSYELYLNSAVKATVTFEFEKI
jgi:hypothetical protein